MPTEAKVVVFVARQAGTPGVTLVYRLLGCWNKTPWDSDVVIESVDYVEAIRSYSERSSYLYQPDAPFSISSI